VPTRSNRLDFNLVAPGDTFVKQPPKEPKKGDMAMKKVWLLAAMVGGVVGGLIMPIRWRAKLSEPLAPRVAGMVENIPDG
jgi:hypothetical protein